MWNVPPGMSSMSACRSTTGQEPVSARLMRRSILSGRAAYFLLGGAAQKFAADRSNSGTFNKRRIPIEQCRSLDRFRSSPDRYNCASGRMSATGHCARHDAKASSIIVVNDGRSDLVTSWNEVTASYAHLALHP